MEFLIADTFATSLGRLTGEEQKRVKTTAFDLQMNPANPGMSFHKLDRARDKRFWSVRVSRDIRLIVHKSEASLLLCYVDHHEEAYAWAERRKLETHPKTGAAQIVEVRETVQEIVVPVVVEKPETKPAPKALFADLSDEVLHSYGVPTEWLQDAKAATEDSVLTLADHLPAEAAEALLELATGGKPRPVGLVPAETGPFEHPDAQRRFRVMANTEELQRALDFPWDKWTVFLHPEQRSRVERDYSGPARVSGSAGTGKTIVALHRAVYLTRAHPEARVLLATFSETLANALRTKLRRLVGNQPRLAERIDVYSLNSLGTRLFRTNFGPVELIDRTGMTEILRSASAAVPDNRFTLAFLQAEWDQVVDAWQLKDWEAYRDVARLGRKKRLPELQRKTLWTFFERVIDELKSQGKMTLEAVFSALAGKFEGTERSPYDFSVVDESQDLSVAQLRFFSAIGGDRPNALFFAGDLGQRIFQQPYSWKSLGVDIRGRSHTLRVNYRTSHQIRKQADRLLGPKMTDVDGIEEDRSDSVSVFTGPPPEIEVFDTQVEEIEAVGRWMASRAEEGMQPHEFGVLVRSEAQLKRAKAAVKQSGLSFKLLDNQVETITGRVSIATMHLAKGLEFRGVAVMACDDEIIPLQERIEAVGEDADLQEVYDTERHLLYVAVTRARDRLLVTSAGPASEFLDDLRI